MGTADKEDCKLYLPTPGDRTHMSILAIMPAAGWSCLIRITGRHSMDFAGGWLALVTIVRPMNSEKRRTMRA